MRPRVAIARLLVRAARRMDRAGASGKVWRKVHTPRGARGLRRLARAIHWLALMVMRPDDLVEFSRLAYSHQGGIRAWSSTESVSVGLTEDESALLSHIPRSGARLLLLGMGGGREAVPLARMGFSVTGVDFVPEMVQAAIDYAAREGLQVQSLVQELSALDVPAAGFGVAWLSAGMYSCIPTRTRRLAVLARVRDALRPGGHFMCQFVYIPPSQSARAETIRRAMALLTLGNLSYEPGDMLSSEFIHAFPDAESACDEFAEAGFEVARLQTPQERNRWGALLVKP